MEYNKIIAVTGLPGLYELLSSKADGAIVRSLDDKSTRFVSSRIHNFSHLESIEVYTVRDNVNLVDILKAMEASSQKLPDEKDNEALRSYFGKVYPDLDFDRVYVSDLKKMVKWFTVLKANDIEVKLTPPEEEPEAIAEAETTAAEEEKPKAKAAPKEKTAPAPATAAPATAAKKKPEATEKKDTPAKEAKAGKSAKSAATPAKEKATAKKSAAAKDKGEDKPKKPAAGSKTAKTSKKAK
ncbi:MAG TPA: DUF5606 domain-containing protein [Puia sp.]|jgi:hypothetical protein|nr:DUF5606 domain-containing protein [Puia sp.]